MMIRPRNWKSFQHYSERRPSWIKLHRDLLDNFEYHRLPVASKALAPLLWLLASESKTGLIDADHAKLAFRLRMNEFDVGEALKPLIDGAFFESVEVSASELLAERKQNGVSERERETERETEGERDARARGRVPRGTEDAGNALGQMSPEVAEALAGTLNAWHDVDDCDRGAMTQWLAHWSRVHAGREMPSHQRISVAKLLAGLGDADAQLRAVQTAEANGWKALRPGDGRAPRKTPQEKSADARAESERIELQNLCERAERIGFRAFKPGVDHDASTYRYLVERAERDQPRGGTKTVAQLLGGRPQ